MAFGNEIILTCTFYDLWLTCEHFVGKASAMGQWVNQPGQLSLLPSVGQGMSSTSVARWVKLLAAVSPCSECLYEGKADVCVFAGNSV